MRRYLYLLAGAAVGLLLLMGVSASAASLSLTTSPTLFVAMTGNDGNDCLSPATPCRTIQAAVGKAHPDDMISIAAGLYSDHLTISQPLTVAGAGRDATIIDGSFSQRVITVTTSANLHLADLTIQHGVTSEQGGGISNYGVLSVSGCRVWGNRATASGGGIANNGVLTVDDSEISSNWVDYYDGGGLLNFGAATITGSLIAKNGANQLGAGIANYETLSVSASSIVANLTSSTGRGGGIFSVGAFTPTTTTLVNVLVSDNQAATGAGIGSELATLTMTNTTIAFNQGAGIYLGTGGPVTYLNTIVANNTPQNCSYSPQTNVESRGHNLDSGATCGFSQALQDLTNVDPLLGPWQPIGSTNSTRPLLPGSLAIDGGTNVGCPLADMRGMRRPVDGNGDGVAVCDIGAFEYLPPRAYLPLIALNAQPANSVPPGTLTADSYTLHPGECTVLRWTTQNADKVYLNDQMVAAEGSKQVCPAQTTTYTLRVIREGRNPINFTTSSIITVVAGAETDQQKAIRLATAFMRQAVGNAAVDRAQVEVVAKPNGWAVIFRDAYASCAEGPFWPGTCVGPYPPPDVPLVYRDVFACVNGVSWLVPGGGGSLTAPVDTAEVCLNMRLPGAPTPPPLPTYAPSTPQAIRVVP